MLVAGKENETIQAYKFIKSSLPSFCIQMKVRCCWVIIRGLPFPAETPDKK